MVAERPIHAWSGASVAAPGRGGEHARIPIYNDQRKEAGRGE